MRIEGSVAVVTGSAGGIGAAVAQRLLEAGGSVLVTDLDGERLAATADDLERTGPRRVASLAGDCSSEEHIRAAVALAGERLGPVDLYAANAGVGLGGPDAGDDAWETSWQVNLMGHVRATRVLLPGWLERGSGYFVSTASAAGLLTQIGSPTYAVTKHAAVGFAEWLAVTYGRRGIGVSCLCPMGVDTDLLHASETANDGGIGARAVLSAGDVLSPLQVADDVVAAVTEERFLVLPHPQVLTMLQQKTSDHDRWIAGMQRYQESLQQP